MTGRAPPRDRIHITLAGHVQLAAADLKLFQALCQSMKANLGLTRCAHDFVWFTVRALRDAGVSHLYRLYDTSRTGVSLVKLVKSAPSDTAGRAEDLKSVSEANPLVKKLLRLRHHAIGHTGEEALDVGLDKYISGYPISSDEMQELLTTAHRVLEKYSGQRMTLVTPATNDQAIRELMDLESYLGDAIPGLYGIERIVLERNGNP